jgi:Flp pilus assembly protein TadG
VWLRRRRGEEGAALAEFAICLPFLSILVFGTIDLGRLFQTQQQLKNAAREGAVYGARFPGRQTAGTACVDPDNIVWHATHESSQSFTITVNGATPSCLTGTLASSLQPGQPLRIAASTTFTPFTPMASRIFGSNRTLTSSVCVNIAGAAPATSTCP